MQGAARALFVPMSLAVGFAMIASYILSSSFVPVMCAWLLKPQPRKSAHEEKRAGLFEGIRSRYEQFLPRAIRSRWLLVGGYLATSSVVLIVACLLLGRGIFPVVDAGQFRLRICAADGTHIVRTEQLAKQASLIIVRQELGPDSVQLSLGYVGMIHSNFPINAVYQWTRGPEESILYVDLNKTLV